MHLFSWQQQVHIATVLVRLLRQVPGSVLVGRQMGFTDAGEYPSLEPGVMLYRHDEGFFRELWNEVGRATGTRWHVEAPLDTVGLHGLGDMTKKPHWYELNMRRQLFTVTLE